MCIRDRAGRVIIWKKRDGGVSYAHNEQRRYTGIGYPEDPYFGYSPWQVSNKKFCCSVSHPCYYLSSCRSYRMKVWSVAVTLRNLYPPVYIMYRTVSEDLKINKVVWMHWLELDIFSLWSTHMLPTSVLCCWVSAEEGTISYDSIVNMSFVGWNTIFCIRSAINPEYLSLQQINLG